MSTLDNSLADAGLSSPQTEELKKLEVPGAVLTAGEHTRTASADEARKDAERTPSPIGPEVR